MSPPWPPLPPSGPARGLNFSRRTETHPLPPWPARRCSVTWSTKLAIRYSLLWALPVQTTKGEPQPALRRRNCVARRLRRDDDVDDATAALLAELHRTRLEGE